MRFSVTLLQYEHGLIRQVIDVLAEMVKRQDMEKHRRQAISIVRFLDEYVDKFHHPKEERFLFPAGARAVGGMKDEVERLLLDHRKARAMISKMKRQAGQADKPLAKEFAPTARQLIDHLVTHIRHEEDLVFPRFEEALSMEEDEKLAMDYAKFAQGFDPEFVRRAEDFAVKMQDEVLGPGYYEGIR